MDYTVSSVLSLISKIHSATADFLCERMKERGLPDFVTSHGFILFVLSKYKQMSFGELSEKINRDKSTTTVLVKKLEKSGLVEIKKCGKDNRRKYVFLTEKGEDYNCVTEKLSDELLETSYKNFSSDEKNTLLYLLEKLHTNIVT